MVHAQSPVVARIEALVRRLPTPHPFTLRELEVSLSRNRSRPLRFIGAELGGTAPAGWLVRTDSVDYVCYPTNTSALHQLHIVLHEVGHLLLDHAAAPLSTIAHHRADTDDERAAELFATLATRHILQSQPVRLPAPSPSPDVLALGTLFGPQITEGDGR